ncbi:MAG: hypothetical protein CO127_10250 [Ignavibacteria bacterium CG_4_9_14_3_um_filter_36_18]|nr:MAG: hypothetical protein CO127_10250 [Ignavibacteria bacterium CG_4_9_14_3_um_filter_36_18]
MNEVKNYFKMWFIPLLLVMIMAGCEDRNAIMYPPVITTPTVTATNPVDLSTSVPFNQNITATFSEAMDSSTITSATFTLMQGSSFVSGTVSYTGIIANFSPSSNLEANTTYIATMTTMAKSLAGVALKNNYVWSFTTGAAAAIVPPAVTYTDPVNGATSVPINQKIAATFSVEMDASTVTTSTFTLLHGTSAVSGFVSYSGTTAIFAPSSNLVPNTAYTATITNATKDLAGNAMATDYVWSFTTGPTAVVTPPTVSSTDPINGEIGVPFNQKIAAAFSKTMDATTITASTFTLTQGTNSVSGFVSYSGTTAIFAPAANLLPNTSYKATITTGAKDLAGNALASNYVWNFTTGAAAVITPPTVSFTDPANAEVGVALNQKVAATFSKTMDASTITTATFTLKQGTTSVSGFVSYTGTTATFVPLSNLAPNATYSAAITTGAKDLAGNALVNDYLWSFTTGSAIVVTPPTVSSTNPANSEIDVALNQKIAATFSKTMDASSITASTFILMNGTTPVFGFVSYSGTTGIFAPASNLLPFTRYTATITTGVKDLNGNSMVNDYVWSFTTGAAPVIIPPTVSSTDPANAATNVALNKQIAATFSKTMNASTITTATFTLMQGTTSVSGFVSYSGTTAIFSPLGNLSPATQYTATITTGAKDLAGNALTNNYVWSFTTGAAPVIIPPTVSSTDPANLETGVALNQQIAATFSKAMNASTITTGTFTLKQGTTSVSGFVSYSGTTAILTPASNLAPFTIYTATITTGAKDLTGNALTNNYVWTFTTGAAPVIIPPTVSLTDPAHLETGVALNKHIAATFSKAMNASTITAATFTLKQGTTSVTGFVSYSGTTAIFVPASNLSASTEYTATITTGAKDLTGNALVSNYVWRFTTGTAPVIVPPTVISTDPVDGEIGVALSKQITATFSKAMNASTITTATFTLMQGLTFVSGTVSYFGTTATYTPSNNLAPFTTYTATITTDAEDLTGNTLAENKVWSFTTGNTYTVSLSSLPVLGGSTSGGGSFNAGATVTVHATPNPGFTFTNWTEGGVEVSTNASYIFTINANRILVANFAAIEYIITLSSNPALGGTTSGGGTFNSGSIVTVNANPNAGFAFTNWTEGGIEVSTNASYTFTISGNRTLVANFVSTVLQYTVTLSANPAAGGAVTQSGTGTYNSGSSVTVTATPNAGFTFTNWTEGGTIVSTNANYQFIITGNRTLVARFDAAGPSIDLGGAAPFGGFGGSAGMTNQGIFTVVNGDIGTTAASTLVTGFHDGGGNVFTETPLNIGFVTGTVFCAPPAPGTPAKFAIAQQALADATNAFNFLAGLPAGPDPGAGELGGLVLAPGTYTSASGTFKITNGDLTLDAQGNPNAVWVFQMAQTLTVGLAGQARSIILVNGAKAKNVYWQVGSAATINGAGGGTMAGTIISYAGVTFSTAGVVELTTLNGRALSLNASVTLVNTIINVPLP